MPFLSLLSSGSDIQLKAAGLLALADLRSIARWTAITGSASWLDVLFLAPGIHLQQSASELGGGEYPPTAALTTGYVFRVENEATVRYLRSVGRPGHLTNVAVESAPISNQWTAALKTRARSPGALSWGLYLLGPVFTIFVISTSYRLGDYFALWRLSILIAVRVTNVIVIKRRSRRGWKGASEHGEHGDLLVLLSQDRWIRLQGFVDDLKTVTSGQWLRDMSWLEELIVTTATMTVYLAAMLSFDSSTVGNLTFLLLLFSSEILLQLVNAASRGATMYGCILSPTSKPIAYARRLDLVDQLVKESGRDDWAVGLGMISKSMDEGGRKATL